MEEDDRQMYEECAKDILREAIRDAGYELMHAGVDEDQMNDAIRRLFLEELDQ